MKNDALAPGLAVVTNGAQETIPTVQYGNVILGPASVSKVVEDTPEAIAAGLRECLKAAEVSLAEERQAILDMIHGK